MALHRPKRELRVSKTRGVSPEGGQKGQHIGPAGNDLLAVVGQLMGFLDLLKVLGDSPSVVRNICVFVAREEELSGQIPRGERK